MLITNIENQVRTRTWVSTSQYSQAQFLLDVNEAKDEFWSAVVARLEEDSDYEEWTTDSVALQSEYTTPTVAYNTAWAKILKSIAINYDGDTYSETWLLKYTRATEVNKDTLEYEWNWYVENQDTDKPIYFIADNSFFIAPAPRTTGTDYIKLTGIRKIPDYTIATTEAEMKIPVDFQRLLIWAIMPLALMAKRVDENTIQKAEITYESKKAVALQNMSTRKEWPVFMTYPPQYETDDIIINVA